MKKCLRCEQIYGDETNFCLADGTALVSFSGSFSNQGETPTVYGGAPPPTVQSGAPFVPPVSGAPETPRGRTLLIALAVGFFALLIGGAILGLIIYGLFKSDAGNISNTANSADKANKSASDGQRNAPENTVLKNKQQQEKSNRDQRSLEDDRQASDARKKEPAPPPTPSNATTAVIIDPPTNIRATPNGAIICVVRRRGTVVNILGSTNVKDGNGTWYYTDACGGRGVIHSTQIRF
ncbi:MAG TPA: hypothetical protein VIL74_11360 [Pyrinomonadaceae bacterium]|jgi:hypothetical protein